MLPECRWAELRVHRVPAADGGLTTMSCKEIEGLMHAVCDEAELARYGGDGTNNDSHLIDWISDKTITPLYVWMCHRFDDLPAADRMSADEMPQHMWSKMMQARAGKLPDAPFANNPRCAADMWESYETFVVEDAPRRERPPKGPCAKCGNENSHYEILPGDWFCSWECVEDHYAGRFSFKDQPRHRPPLDPASAARLERSAAYLRSTPLISHLSPRVHVDEVEPLMFVSMGAPDWEAVTPYCMVVRLVGGADGDYDVLTWQAWRNYDREQLEEFRRLLNSGPAEYRNDPIRILQVLLENENGKAAKPLPLEDVRAAPGLFS